MSQIIKEVAKVLGITLQHATTKHARNIGMLERTHASLKKHLNSETVERRSKWHKYVNTAVLNYNTSHHRSIGCEQSRVFHGRIPHNVLNLKMGIRPQVRKYYLHQICKVQKMFSNKRKGLFMMSATTPCKLISNTKHNKVKNPMLRNLKDNNMCTFYSLKQITREISFFSDFRGTGPYIVKKASPKNNYLVRDHDYSRPDNQYPKYT